MSKPDCLRCGMCCVAPSGQPSFANLDDEDIKKLGSKLARKLVNHPTIFSMMFQGDETAIKTVTKKVRLGVLKGVEATTCVCLKGSPGHQVRCEIYKVRPKVCHVAVKPGDKICRGIRRDLRTIEKELAKQTADSKCRPQLTF